MSIYTADDIIQLNVGGKIFMTSKATLIKSPYFENYFNCNQIKNNILIDRDPVAFEYVLHVLKNPNYEIPEQYISELGLYGIELNEINPKKPNIENRNKQEINATNELCNNKKLSKEVLLNQCYEWLQMVRSSSIKYSPTSDKTIYMAKYQN